MATIKQLAADAKKKDKELNQKLKLSIPKNILTEHITYWNQFFVLMRYAYRNQILNEQNIADVITLFSSLQPSQYPNAINEIFLEISNEEDLRYDMNMLNYADQTHKQIVDILEELPPELKIKAYQELYNIDISDEFEEVSEQDLLNEINNSPYRDPLDILQDIQNSDGLIVSTVSKDKVADIIQKTEKPQRDTSLSEIESKLDIKFPRKKNTNKGI